ncbi:OmpH family outer membrane protein [uncultured Tateyamaria sp.]|uniref:OmpH family outer membrane protein n=1 Tax=Tateyamaria sp. 1078 TaxID=3417464 RepID=UPI002619B163|nr:OmpH family outer membrane protein [uncultured Tateyamaria sp.]
MFRRYLVALVLIIGLAPFASAQVVQSPILTIDSERLYRDSDFGQRVLREIEERTQALTNENIALEAELEAEEKALTEQRDTLTPEEFRALADAFDARVQAIRRDREARNKENLALLDDNQARFLRAALPVLEAIMRDVGAAVVLEVRSVFVSSNAIDITDRAIAEINAAVGDGTTPVPND